VVATHFSTAFKQAQAYDPVLNRWRACGRYPIPRHDLAVGAIGSRLYNVSGEGQSAGNGIDPSAVPFNETI
jgi:hypothetical protein